jgi:Leucine-rich repeat (LRR) protein
MILFKISRLLFVLTISTSSYVFAMQKHHEVVIERSPSRSPHLNHVSPHQSPLKLSPVKPARSYRTLEIDTPLEVHELGQLMDRNCKEIYLHGVYVIIEKSDDFFKHSPLVISPKTINPDVEILSLKGCGLTDDLIKQIGEFKKLKKLVLSSNFLTDAGVISSISHLESLESLTLANNDISNASIRALLAMPNLSELDLSHNKKINEESAEVFLQSSKLKKLDVRYTGISRKAQRNIEDKYKN